MSDLERKIQERIEQNELQKQEPIFLLGRDITKVACFKPSMITGMLSGAAGGILTFMFTSKPNLASHTMIGSFIVMTMGYYGVCRYQFAKEMMMVDKMKGLMQEAMMLEGIEREEKLEQVSKLMKM
uniref:Cytochrome c oxidase assembly protein COX20, mitochondrial n=1 Tax=Bracon brevicornis TaxID=1563983 RepID=A0A6V7I2I0_9HYME